MTPKNKTKSINSKAKSWKESDNIVIRTARWTYHSILLVSTLTILAIYLFSAFSDHIDPSKLLLPSYFGISYHIILIIAIVWLVTLIVVHHWKMALILLAGFVVSWKDITRYFPLHVFANSAETVVFNSKGEEIKYVPDTLKLLTYNTCLMGQSRLSDIKKDVEVVEFVKTSGADVVCLQEYAFSLGKGHTQDQIKKHLSRVYPYYDFMPNYQSRSSGIAIFSKYPITNMVRIDKKKKDYVSSMFYEINFKGEPILLVNNHLCSNKIKIKDRQLYSDMFEHFEKDSLESVRTGILRSLGPAFRKRSEQTKLIKAFIAKRTNGKDVPLIICGDMNDTPISYCYRTLRGQLDDAWQNAGFGAGTTYNKYHIWFRIDHVFHSKHFKTLDIEVMKDVKYSDHYPVFTTLQLLKQIKE